MSDIRKALEVKIAEAEERMLRTSLQLKQSKNIGSLLNAEWEEYLNDGMGAPIEVPKKARVIEFKRKVKK